MSRVLKGVFLGFLRGFVDFYSGVMVKNMQSVWTINKVQYKQE